MNVGPIKKEAAPAPAQEVNPYAQEYQRLSGQVGRKPAEVRQDVLKLAKEKATSELVALALWKSAHKNQLGGKTDSFTGRLLAVDGPRQAVVEGHPSIVATLVWAVLNGKEYELRAMSLWASEDRNPEELVASVQVDGLYTFRGAIRPGEDSAIRLVEGSFAPSNIEFATADQFAGAEPTPLAEAVKMAAKARVTVLTQGIVGRVFVTERGAGLELSDVGVDIPVATFLGAPLNGVAEGAQVKVLGQISTKQGVATINGYRVWPT